MDFGTLLHVAKKNSETSKNEGKYYSTKFAPPKKESKDKKLSDNIKRFLQKRDEEERQRKEEERKKLNNLLAMRDEKSKNKIKKMLKVTKSANKSVLDDINTEQTAVTMEGPEQPDQDDYGYVSNEANAFYQKYIEKVKDVKDDKGFAPSRPQSLRDLSGTKERVKAAITREIEEKKGRHRTTTTHSSTKDSLETVERGERTRVSSKPVYDPEAERLAEERKKREEMQQKAKNRKPLPPPMDFQALLKLAEVKQHEPVEILLPTVKKKEPERLLTSKEKREWEERQRAKEARDRRLREKQSELEAKDNEKPINRMEPNGRIPKLNQAAKANPISSSSTAAAIGSPNDKSKTNTASLNAAKSSLTERPASAARKEQSHNNTVPSKTIKNPYTNSTSTNAQHSTAKSTNIPCDSGTDKKLQSSSIKSAIKTSTVSNSTARNVSTEIGRESKTSQSKSVPTSNVQKTRQFPPQDVGKTRQFPPSDVQKTRQLPQYGRKTESSMERKKSQAPKRRILDDDSEYDSEMDDFIDDGDCEEDYSSHIKAIFGYDKSKYRYMDDDDDAAMESNFAQVQREEYISKKIGIQEDLEDMKLEAMEKKRKMMKRRK